MNFCCISFQLVLCGAFYPNYFLKNEIDEQESLRSMSGQDPFNTVMVGTNMKGQHRIITVTDTASWKIICQLILTKICIL